MKWRIYYDDGSMFDSGQGGPEDAPGHGVVCIVQPDEEIGRTIMQGWDWYYFHEGDGNWWGCDIHGLTDRLTHRLPVRAVCEGRTVATERFRQILRLADLDEDFPRKSAKRKLERP
jgi:hypothetical protein